MVDWTVDRSHANSGLIVGEEVEGIASSNADPEASGGRNQGKGVEIDALEDTAASVVIAEHASKWSRCVSGIADKHTLLDAHIGIVGDRRSSRRRAVKNRIQRTNGDTALRNRIAPSTQSSTAVVAKIGGIVGESTRWAILGIRKTGKTRTVCARIAACNALSSCVILREITLRTLRHAQPKTSGIAKKRRRADGNT